MLNNNRVRKRPEAERLQARAACVPGERHFSAIYGKNRSVADKRFVRHILRKVFLEDWGLKLLALAITLALWLGVTGLSTPSRRNLTVALNTIVANDTIIMNSPRQQIEVVLGGDKRRFDQLNPGDISATLDVSDLLPGEWVKPLSPETITINNLPQGITLEEVRPNNMAIKLDAVSERDIAVRVDTTGAVASGFEVYTTTAMPQRIRVRGSTNLIKLIDYVQTERIDVSGRRESFSAKQVAVTSPNPSATVLNTIVDVFVVIGERRMERTFTAPVAGEPGKIASFTILGPRSILQEAKPEDFKVDVYLDENGELKPRLVLPDSLDEVSEIRNLRFK